VLAERDRHRPTGAYLKHPGTSGSRMYYYRTGSAATAMDADLFDAPAVRHLLAGCGVVHTTGITAAVLAEGSRLLPRLVEERDRHGFVLSVDLNWRPSLWRQRDRRTLHELLAAADVLFLGTDEAEEALGTADPQRLRERLGGRSRLVLKSDAHVATESGPEDATTEVPALGVEVVEQVGAGDGFAAGYLTGLLEGRGPVGRLRLGHLVAAAVLSEPGDHVTRLPDAAARDLLLEATADEWRHTRVTVTGVESPALGTAGGAR
jgi:2-dehydro-3-deoxygluconokinase